MQTILYTARTKKTEPQDALRILDESWSYYRPEPARAETKASQEPELFQYFDAA